MRFDHIKSKSTYKSAFLDSVGDGTGSISITVNASGAPVYFKHTCGVREIILVNRFLLHLGDGGSIDSGLYGNGIALVNGIELGIMDKDDVVLLDLTKNLSIKTNSDWAAFCYDVQVLSFGQGDEYMAVRWTFTKDGAALRLNEGESFFMKVNDNLTGLKNHHAKLGMVSLQK